MAETKEPVTTGADAKKKKTQLIIGVIAVGLLGYLYIRNKNATAATAAAAAATPTVTGFTGNGFSNNTNNTPGPVGATGAAGATGATGANGIQGLPGLTGLAGAIPSIGSTTPVTSVTQPGPNGGLGLLTSTGLAPTPAINAMSNPAGAPNGGAAPAGSNWVNSGGNWSLQAA